MNDSDEVRCRDVLSAWMAAADTRLPVRPLDHPDHKWRATSAWQKAIRRGDRDTALRAVSGLWALDPRYVLYRLPIILLEDIGWGDPELTQVGMMACSKRCWDLDAELAVLLLTDRAAAAVKDRTTCDLAVATNRLFVADPEIKTIFLEPDVAARVDILSDTLRSPFARMAALWSLAGSVRHPDENVMTPYPVGPDEWQPIADLLSDSQTRVWRSVAGRMRNAMPLACLLTGEYQRSAVRSTVVHDALPAEVVVAGYPAGSFDWFTREGRRAIDLFLRRCRAWQEWLSQYTVTRGDQRILTARFLFRVEGALVDQQLVFEPWSPIITRMPLQAAAAAHGLTAADVDHGKRLLARSLAELNEVRQEVADR